MNITSSRSLALVASGFFLCTMVSFSQIGMGTTTPDASAILDINSETQGVLVPRMNTTQRNAIASPAEGLLIYDTDEDSFYFYNSSGNWQPLTSGGTTPSSDASAGSIYLNSSASTTLSAGNPTKIEGTTTAVNMVNTALIGNNRIVYTGSETRVFQYTVSISFSSDNNEEFNLYIAKGNGVGSPLVEVSSKQTRTITALSDRFPMTLNGLIELQTNDYIEVWIENTTSDTSPEIHTMNLTIR